MMMAWLIVAVAVIAVVAAPTVMLMIARYARVGAAIIFTMLMLMSNDVVGPHGSRPRRHHCDVDDNIVGGGDYGDSDGGVVDGAARP